MSEEDWPDNTNKRTMGSFTPDVVKDYDYQGSNEKFRLIEYYSKVKVPYYRVLDKRTNQEKIIEKEQFDAMSQEGQFINAIEKGLIKTWEATTEKQGPAIYNRKYPSEKELLKFFGNLFSSSENQLIKLLSCFV